MGSGNDAASKNNTLEINPSHPIIVKLNELRKKDSKRAGLLSKQLMDNILLSSGIPFDLNSSAKRNLDVMNQRITLCTTSYLSPLNDFLNVVTKDHSLLSEGETKNEQQQH